MDATTLNSDQLNELEKLGLQLEAANWAPKDVYLEQYGIGEWLSDRVKLALSFVVENRIEIQSALCRDQRVAPGIKTAGNTMSAVLDAVQGLGGLPVPAWSIANTVCMLGISRFCSWEPK